MDHPNLAGTAVVMSYLPATFKSCHAVLDPGCAVPYSTVVCASLAEEAAPRFSSLHECVASRALSLFSLCKLWQGEKALLTVWQREEVDVNGIGKQELFQREAHLERKKSFRGIRVGAIGPESREDGVSLQEMLWGSLRLTDPQVSLSSN